MIFRSKAGVEVFTVPRKDSDAIEKPTERRFLLEGVTTLQHFAPDGSRVFLHQPAHGVVMCALDGTGEKKTPFLENSQGVSMLSSSPKGTYLLTWERLSSTSPEQPNLKVWNSKTGAYLHGFVQKNLSRDSWPYLQWTYDEKFAFLLVTNEIRVYEGDAFAKDEVRFIEKMRCPGLSSMSVPNKADTLSYLVASFSPKTKEKPARASLHKYPAEVPPNATSYPAIVSKSLFQAEEVKVHWSPKGNAALMVLQTSVDHSGESYYGSGTLYLMTEESSDAIAVPLPNNSTGPVLDVAWLPNPSKPSSFVVISGKMPALASLHKGSDGEALFIFGNAHRNTISWAPHGRFVCLAGFGNLAGGMSFWDRNKLKVIPQYDMETGIPVFPEVTASCTVGYGWSPDSRCFGASTTSPRMNVDNGVRLFRYNGEELTNVPWKNENYQPDKLLEASFIPALPDVYEDRPQSPAPRIAGDADAIAKAKKEAAEAATKPAAPVVQRYVPPSARNRGSGGGTSLAERMRAEKEGNMMKATRVIAKPVVPGLVPTGKNLPVGMVAEEPVKSKSAIRRERQKKNKVKQEENEVREKEEAEKEVVEEPSDPEKRIRKIKKTLKQIEDLKERGLSELNDDQMTKLASEEELRKELAQLEI
jgi:translation initiation factor 2A